jgi:ribose-phosphate pyrophosphokinase
LEKLAIIVGGMHPKLGERVCANLGVAPCAVLAAHHADGANDVQVLESIRDKDVFVIQPTGRSDTWYKQLRVILDAARRASPRNLTAVIPYLDEARQDRRSGPREPITLRLQADEIEQAGANGVMLVDLHSLQGECAFSRWVRLDHLQAFPLVAARLWQRELQAGRTTFMGPDGNATGRYAKPLFQHFRGSRLASLFKSRRTDTDVETMFLVGAENVYERDTVLIDDIISTATTTANGVEECKKAKAQRVEAIATHSVMVGRAYEILASSPVSRVTVTNTLPTSPERARTMGERFEIIDVAPLLAEAIKRVHCGKSISCNGSVDGLFSPSYWIARIKKGLELVVSIEENTSPSVKLAEETEALLSEIAIGKRLRR